MYPYSLSSHEKQLGRRAAPLACCVIGDGTLTRQCCDIIVTAGHSISAIVTSNPDVRAWSDAHGVTCHPTLDALADAPPEPLDVLFSIVNMRLIPPALLARPRFGAINFHDGPLPRYAGAHATSWALINRETNHGVTWHLITEEIDAGDILEQTCFELSGNETAHVLNSMCLEAGIESFERLIERLGKLGRLGKDALPAQPQDVAKRSYFSLFKRPEAAGVISWRSSAADIEALVRGLDFGPTENPLGRPKIYFDGRFFICGEISRENAAGVGNAGQIIKFDKKRWIVETATGAISISSVSTIDGQSIDLGDLEKQNKFRVGKVLPELSKESRAAIEVLNAAASRAEAYWVGQLENLAPVALPQLRDAAGREAAFGQIDRTVRTDELDRIFGPEAHDAQARWTAGFAAFLARLQDEEAFDIGLRTSVTGEVAGLFAPVVPLRIDIDAQGGLAGELGALAPSIRAAANRGAFARDVVTRYPGLSHLAGHSLAAALPVQVEFVDTLDQAASDTDFAVRIVIPASGERCRWKFDRSRITDDEVHALVVEVDRFLATVAADPPVPLARYALISPEEQRTLLETWNETAVELDGASTIHAAFEAQAARTPDAVAVACGDREITYGELNRRANRLARHLRSLGAGPDELVGIALDRSIDMVAALLAILKAGAAYVPLDPAYPAERLAHMLEDSGAAVLLTQEAMLPKLPRTSARLVLVDVDWPEIEAHDGADLDHGARPDDLAYVIYTSGSTGRPKGVMVEHHNVANFFAGMDRTIELGPDPVWLAVTSLSFDISVLEIFWTLSRGCKVVVYTREEFEPPPAAALPAHDRAIDFSLFFFSADQGEEPDHKYRLLLEGAKFADANGFKAVWTPERHFHEFGGLYPNPSVTGAALAVATSRVEIRSGSIVAPLHSPIRIAEEWSVVDNLSGGRVGLSFASGWMPEDFAIRPETFHDRKAVMMDTIDAVRRLWRGEVVEFPGVDAATPVRVRTLPRPLQAELPVWVTTAGNPETYEMAARAGANVLTHLLGQSIEEVAEKVRIYREIWKASGHPGRGCVSLMLHTFVSDRPDVRDIVREPLKAYLRTSASLIKKYSWAFPTFTRHGTSVDDVNFSDLTADELEAVLDHAFERYYETSGLFGSVADCEATIARLKQNDIDDVACLIDFGVPVSDVLDGLEGLDRLREATSAARQPAPAAGTGGTIAELIARHRVTHFQCTPSMAALLVLDDATRTELARLRTWLVGGEALSSDLARTLCDIVEGDVINMYGPTETTVWSTACRLSRTDDRVRIGRPIANTRLYVVDRRLRPVPIGQPGELLIGGAGVVRGYFARDTLTAERFIKSPFAATRDPRHAGSR